MKIFIHKITLIQVVLSVAKYADKVIFMEDSGIKGFDTHEKLLESIESYRVLYESQAKHYK